MRVLEPTDSEMLDWLDRKSGSYTGKVVFRWSETGRGWRLHETNREGHSTVREAIAAAMADEEKQHVTQVCLSCKLRQPLAAGPCRRCGSSMFAKGMSSG